MIYLLGGSGAPNFGDELMLQHWLLYTGTRRRMAGAQASRFDVVVDNNNVANSERQFATRFPHARFVSAFKRVRAPAAGKDFLANLRFGFEFFSKGHYRNEPLVAQALADLERADLIHIYGGGYINTHFAPHGAVLLGLVADAARFFGKRVVATGLGLTPLAFGDAEDTRVLSEVLARYELLEVRDVPSFQQLRKAAGALPSVVMGHDDSLLFPPVRNPGRSGHRKLHLSAIKNGNLFDKPGVIAQVRAARPAFDELVYWNCAPFLERELTSGLLTHFPDMRVAELDELLFEGLPVDPGDFMVTMRFHPHMVASRLGCSGTYWAGSQYYEHKHGSVVQLGSRFEKHGAEPIAFETLEQPIAWREPAHNLAKALLAQRLYDPVAG